MSSPYTLAFADDAVEDLKRLDKAVAARILRKLEWLADNAETLRHVSMTGEWSDFYRMRVGDYRVLYRLDREARVVEVVAMGHRREIYRE